MAAFTAVDTSSRSLALIFAENSLGILCRVQKGFLPFCLVALVPISVAQSKRLWHVTALQPVPGTGNHPACKRLVPNFFVWKPKKPENFMGSAGRSLGCALQKSFAGNSCRNG